MENNSEQQIYFGHIYIQYMCLGLLLVTHIVNSTSFKLGLENLSINNKNTRFALITNHTGKNQDSKRTIDVLLERGLSVTCILAPEHGFFGTITAGNTVHTDCDTKTKIPIFSLYKNGSGKTVDKDIYDTVDAFIFDMQEAGMRHYTYLSTLLYTMLAAAEHNKVFIVLDRPNLLGNRVEGPLLSADVAAKKSFIAAAHIPLRHGMTIGELAAYFNTCVLKKPTQLHIVKMTGYTRQTTLPSTLTYNLSPNIINKQSCYGYSFLGLLGEVRPFDVGLGTSHPFSTIALPAHMRMSTAWRQLQGELERKGVKANRCTYVSSRKKIAYEGLHLNIQAIEQVHAFEILLHVFDFFKKRGVVYEFSADFDRAVGTELVRHYVQENIPRTTLVDNLNKELKQFWLEAKNSFLYKPWPIVTVMK
jgi:uncharacterized protein YbbC (DUF1343 family)